MIIEESKKRDIYIVLEHLEDRQFTWSLAEIKNVIFHWNEGYSTEYINGVAKRESGEVELLIMSIEAETRGIIKTRDNGFKQSSPLNLPNRYNTGLQHFYNSIKEENGIYVSFQNVNIDYFWDEGELLLLELNCIQKKPLQEIAKHFKKSILDVSLAIIDRYSRKSDDDSIEGVF
jgi:hypothetical protein